MFASALWLSLDVGKHSPGILDHVASVLRKSRGACPVHMVVSNGGGKAARLKLGDSFSINPASVALKELEDLLGPGRVKFTGSR